jgi:hypothetical protein
MFHEVWHCHVYNILYSPVGSRVGFGVGGGLYDSITLEKI